MCVLIVNNPYLADGWGCCHCPDAKTYNGLWRDAYKACGAQPCALGRAEDPDVIEPRGRE